ncbi:MAG TPA: hypothetical protein VGF28_07465 [Thermoanaerobaculia bacterium]|jgi:predicted acylesterase/phospholipase RssA
MTDPVLTSIISVAGALVAAVAGYVFTKRAERESRWRDEKLAHYKEFMKSMSGIIHDESTREGQIRFAKACNDILLFAPQNVLERLRDLQDEISASNTNKSKARHDELLSKLLLAMRRDIGVRPADDERSFRAELRASGAPPERKL